VDDVCLDFWWKDGREVGEPSFEHRGYNVDIVEVFLIEKVDVVFYS
jgi:hypothetical protein